MTPEFESRIDLPESGVTAILGCLQSRVFDAIDLAAQAKQAHWNVKGPYFGPLHELFDDVYGLAGEIGDTVAERAVQLGALVDGSVKSSASKSALEPMPLKAEHGPLVEAMADSLASLANALRGDIDDALKAKDQVTANLLADLAGKADKQLWKVEAHLFDL